MRRFAYYDQSDELHPVIVTEAAIMGGYEAWAQKMREQHRIPGTPEDFLLDWCTHHWAWEVREDTPTEESRG